jgi:hypothetical protein
MTGLITTTKGPMDPAQLRKVEGVAEDTETNRVTFVEYYDGGELVHRSVNLHIKKGVEVRATGGNLG